MRQLLSRFVSLCITGRKHDSGGPSRTGSAARHRRGSEQCVIGRDSGLDV